MKSKLTCFGAGLKPEPRAAGKAGKVLTGYSRTSQTGAPPRKCDPRQQEKLFQSY